MTFASKSLFAFAAVLSLGAPQWVQAEELNLKETPETTTVALSPFSFGPELGGLFALNEELRDKSEAFLELGVATSAIFADHFALGANVDWLLRGSSFGGGITLDYILGQGAFRPFFGVGIGLQYLDNGLKFGDAFGVSGTLHPGILFDITDALQLRLRVPITMVTNQNFDQLAGVDFALLFSSPHRTTRVKKLNY